MHSSFQSGPANYMNFTTVSRTATDLVLRYSLTSIGVPIRDMIWSYLYNGNSYTDKTITIYQTVLWQNASNCPTHRVGVILSDPEWSRVKTRFHKRSCPKGSAIRNISHHNDVIMGTKVSQITSLTIVFATIYSDTAENIQKTSKLRVTGLCVGNSPVTGEFPAQMANGQ